MIKFLNLCIAILVVNFGLSFGTAIFIKDWGSFIWLSFQTSISIAILLEVIQNE